MASHQNAVGNPCGSRYCHVCRGAAAVDPTKEKAAKQREKAEKEARKAEERERQSA